MHFGRPHGSDPFEDVSQQEVSTFAYSRTITNFESKSGYWRSLLRAPVFTPMQGVLKSMKCIYNPDSM